MAEDERYFENRHGRFRSGDRVRFEVENQNMWAGPTSGVLAVNAGGEWGIWLPEVRTTLGIGGWLEAYPNSILAA